MNEWRIKFKEWWAALAEREKRMVSVGTVVVGCFIFYAVIWGPYLNRVDGMRQRVQSEQKTLLWMKSADKEMRKIQGQTTTKAQQITPVALLGYLQKLISQKGMDAAMTQLKQSSNDAVELQFQKVEFDKLVTLLMQVVKEQRVVIRQMSATADSTPGLVDAELTFVTEADHAGG